MAPHKYTPIIVEGFVEVNTPRAGRSLIDVLLETFTIGTQVEQGDYFMDRSRDLLEKHLQLIELDDQTHIRHRYMKARNLKNEVHSDDNNGSQFQRFFQARKYKRQSRRTYKVIKNASDRAIDDSLMNQIPEAGATGATPPPGGGSGSNTGTASVPRNPFTDSHAAPTLTDVAVRNLDRVDMTTYQTADTGEEAVVYDFVARDQSVQHLVSTFPTEATSGDRIDREDSQSNASIVPAALSLHDQDGTVLGFVAESLPDITSDQERGNEEVETRTTASNSIFEDSSEDSRSSTELSNETS